MRQLLSTLTPSVLVAYLAAYLVLFASTKFGLYLFFEWQTSPAVLWPTTGIAIAIIWVGGYRYALPAFLALLTASLNEPFGYFLPAMILGPLAEVLLQVVTVFFLRKFGFTGAFTTMRSMITFLTVIVLTCTIAPTITTFLAWLTGHLTIPAYTAWSRAWAGYIFSTLILTPFILTWLRGQGMDGPKRGAVEAFAASVMLVFSVYFLFWTELGSEFSFLLFALFIAAHLWIGHRFSSREMTLAVFFSTAFGILGLFLSPASDGPINEELFAAELFLFLVVPIFYSFSALIKERAKTIRDLKEALGRIERESTTKNEFIAVLAHELRNPLAPVKTTLEILSMHDLQPDTKQLIESAHRQVHAMRRILDDLLDITRVTQGKFQLQIEHVLLSSMINHCVDSMQATFTRRQQQVTVKAPPKDTIYLEVDSVRFEQVITNILNNASKYTPVGGHIEISYGIKRRSVVISIADDGIGVDEEDLSGIFQPFWQVQSAAIRSGSGGIGVGLSLTKYIVEMHGGTIHAESSGKDKGTTFIITMPISHRVQKTPRHTHKEETPRSCSVLVVDDNKAAANALGKLLRMKEHTVEVAYSGTEVFERLEHFDPMIILLDIGLPVMDGYAIARKLRAEGYKGKIVALSGFGQKEDQERAREAGFDYHITKPMSIKDFEDYLRNLQSTQPGLF